MQSLLRPCLPAARAGLAPISALGGARRCCLQLLQPRRQSFATPHPRLFSAASAAAEALPWEPARFGGADIRVTSAVDESFESRCVPARAQLPATSRPPTLPRDASQTSLSLARLELTLAELSAEGRRGVWLHVPIEHSAAAAAASRHGFAFHHAEGDQALLLRWLPDGPCPVPAFATHIVGVGGLVINDRSEVLCVREAHPNGGGRGSWKLPGGLMDLGEEVSDAVAREVLEETGVVAEFQGLLSMRVQHGAAFGRDDFYFICAMTPLSEARSPHPAHAPCPPFLACTAAGWVLTAALFGVRRSSSTVRRLRSARGCRWRNTSPRPRSWRRSVGSATR